MGLSENNLYPVITKHSSVTMKNIKAQEQDFLESLAIILKNNSVNSVVGIQHTAKESEYIFEEDTDSEFDIEEDFEVELRELERKKLKKRKKLKLKII